MLGQPVAGAGELGHVGRPGRVGPEHALHPRTLAQHAPLLHPRSRHPPRPRARRRHRPAVPAAAARGRYLGARVQAGGHVAQRPPDRDRGRFARVPRRDRHLDHAQAGRDRVDQQLRVEREVVAVAEERQPQQTPPGVRAHPGVQLGEARPQQRVLGHRGDAVPDVAVEGHPAGPGIAETGETRPEGHVGIAGQDRRDQQRHRPGVVLIVGMEQDDDLGAVLERPQVAGLLVAAVAAVALVDVGGDAQPARQRGRAVRAGVVDEDQLVRHAAGDVRHRLGERRLGLIGRQRDCDLWHMAGDPTGDNAQDGHARHAPPTRRGDRVEGCARSDSNGRPADSKSAALSPELRAHIGSNPSRSAG